FPGPSEVVVVADDTAPPDLAAVDVILQAEHGPGGLAWFVSWSEAALDAVCDEIATQVAAAPRRADIESTFAEGGYAVLCDSPEQAIAVSNTIAPEHLELMTEDPQALVPLVRHAGAVFCGPWSPASVGDYLAGPSHVLPTDGTARFGSALTVADFQKDVHVITLSQVALERAAPTVAAIASAEGLAAHADSVLRRLGRSGT
ncbi:MAG TPA: histidinol dehydrogenase, partial [Aquihabitans sp.]|nr:histidinol dehydrogenase [Aquihabitans sp.]